MPTWTCPNCRTAHKFQQEHIGAQVNCSKCSKPALLSADALPSNQAITDLPPTNGSNTVETLQVLCAFPAAVGVVLLALAGISATNNSYAFAMALWGVSALISAGVFALQLEMLNDICKSRKLLERISEQLNQRP